MTYYLDTNICTGHLDGTSDELRLLLEKTTFGKVKIPAMVAAELLHSAEKHKKRIEHIRVVKQFLSLFEIAPFDENAAAHYAAIRDNLERKGQGIGNNYLITAATVMAGGGTLVTNNADKYSRVEGLHSASIIVSS